MIHWNGPPITKADNIIKQALDLHLSGRKKWHFKVTSSKFAVSEVIDRQLKEPAKLSFVM